ncbi:MAG: flotillin family protein, partial [Moorea sp. SIO3G5]|nr:flotillin family protein [Moorena sp. SIO3G5]
MNTTLQTVPVQSSIAQLPPGILFFPGVIGGLIVLLLLSIWAYTRVYVITPNNEAFLRTGGVFIKKKTVILSGGCVVLPGFHELTRVPLREISIDVERTGNLAVRTQDYLRANMRVTFYVCINA